MAKTFQCTLVTPSRQVLDEQVTYASMPAWDGQIGLAPQRAPLLVKLGDGMLRLEFESGNSQTFFIAGGFAQMKDNRLTLLTDQAMEAGKIDRAESESALKEAQARAAAGDEQIEQRQQAIDRARAKLHAASQA